MQLKPEFSILEEESNTVEDSYEEPSNEQHYEENMGVKSDEEKDNEEQVTENSYEQQLGVQPDEENDIPDTSNFEHDNHQKQREEFRNENQYHGKGEEKVGDCQSIFFLRPRKDNNVY